jgi:hypothetical protein
MSRAVARPGAWVCPCAECNTQAKGNARTQLPSGKVVSLIHLIYGVLGVEQQLVGLRREAEDNNETTKTIFGHKTLCRAVR